MKRIYDFFKWLVSPATDTNPDGSRMNADPGGFAGPEREND